MRTIRTAFLLHRKNKLVLWFIQYSNAIVYTFLLHRKNKLVLWFIYIYSNASHFQGWAHATIWSRHVTLPFNNVHDETLIGFRGAHFFCLFALQIFILNFILSITNYTVWQAWQVTTVSFVIAELYVTINMWITVLCMHGLVLELKRREYLGCSKFFISWPSRPS